MRVERLGKRASFLIPSVKVYNKKYSVSRRSVAQRVNEFLQENFQGYTCASGNIYGYFASDTVEYDELREFRVAFADDDRHSRLIKLKRFLGQLCEDIGEECIYLEYGDEAMLVYPERDTRAERDPFPTVRGVAGKIVEKGKKRLERGVKKVIGKGKKR